MEKQYKLVKYDGNWADEFDIEQLDLIEADEYDEIIEFIKNVDDNKLAKEEFYFGTNEWVNFESKDEILNSIKAFDITQEQYDFLYKVFGNRKGFGLGVGIKKIYEVLVED